MPLNSNLNNQHWDLKLGVTNKIIRCIAVIFDFAASTVPGALAIDKENKILNENDLINAI